MTKKIDVLISGYPSMDRIINLSSSPKVGYTSLIENAANGEIHYGGCSINIASILANLGKTVAPVFRVGSDYEAIGLKSFLENLHMNLDGVMHVAQDTTTNSYIIADENKNHMTLVYPGSMDEKYFQNVADSLFEQSQLAVMTVSPYRDNLSFLEKCQKYNIPLVFGMKTDKAAFPVDFLEKILWYSNIIFCNESERTDIESLLNIESAKVLLEKGNAQILVTTMGAQGSMCEYIQDGVYHQCNIPILPCTPKDTTGVGDAYIAGFLYAFLAKMPIETACYYGAACSACVIEELGSLGNIPTLEKIKQKLPTHLGGQAI